MRDIDDSEMLSAHLVAIERKINADSIQYSFVALRYYLESVHNLKIIVAPVAEVPSGGAVGCLADDGCRYIILVNDQDYAQKDGIVRFRIAHELAHISCGHVTELNLLTEMGLGDAGAPEKPYVVLRNLQEDEADVFAANLYYAFGEVVERRIPSEQEYGSEIGKLKISLWEGDEDNAAVERDSVLNRQSNRDGIRSKLRREGFMRPPVPILCQAIRPLLPDFDGQRVRRMAELVHRKYRERLGTAEQKPEGGACRGCADAAAAVCSE